LRDLCEASSPVDIVDACRQTIREWHEEYLALERPEALLACLTQCLSALEFSYERHADPVCMGLVTNDRDSWLCHACANAPYEVCLHTDLAPLFDLSGKGQSMSETWWQDKCHGSDCAMHPATQIGSRLLPRLWIRDYECGTE
jgi:hypothetical protein